MAIAIAVGSVAVLSRFATAWVFGAPSKVTARLRESGRAATATSNEISVDVEEGAVSSPGLLKGERYVAMNRFMVRDGADPAFEQRWATRKSSLIELDGFKWFGLLRRVPPPSTAKADYKYDDDYNYVSFTVWENKKNFNAWRVGPAFKEAHGGGNIFGFVSMIISGFMTSKGPPKPAFWYGMLVDKSTQEKPRLQTGPGGRPDFDGSKVLDPEVFVTMNRFTVAKGREVDFEQRWAQRESQLQQMPGFRFFQLMRRDQTPDDDVNYMSVACWDDAASFQNWASSDAFKASHGSGSKSEGDKAAEAQDNPNAGKKAYMGGILEKPPLPYFYEGKLVLESVPGV